MQAPKPDVWGKILRKRNTNLKNVIFFYESNFGDSHRV